MFIFVLLDTAILQGGYISFFVALIKRAILFTVHIIIKSKRFCLAFAY